MKAPRTADILGICDCRQLRSNIAKHVSCISIMYVYISAVESEKYSCKNTDFFHRMFELRIAGGENADVAQ